MKMYKPNGRNIGFVIWSNRVHKKMDAIALLDALYDRRVVQDTLKSFIYNK